MKTILHRVALDFLSPVLTPHATRQDAETHDLISGMEYAPMSSLLWCLSSLAAVYFVVCTALVIVRMWFQLRRIRGSSEPPGVLQNTFESAELAMEFAPMLCVLFLAAQMQALAASEGHDDPPTWILRCMEVATTALLLQTLLAVLLPVVMGKSAEVDEDVGLVGGAPLLAEAQQSLLSGETSQMIQGFLVGFGQVLSYLASFTIYGTCGAICAGILIRHMRMVEESSPLDPNPAVSPAVSCTVNLTIQFFVVRLLLAAAGLCLRGGRGACASKLFEVLKLASSTVFFAPMLCVLFIAAQIRANQIGKPLQPWAGAAFHACAFGLLFQTLLTLALPYLPCLHVDAKRGTRWMEGDVQFGSVTSDKASVGILLTILRYIPMFFVCGGFAVVIVNLLASSSVDGERISPVPPAIQCATALTVQFFSVFLVLRIAISIRDITHGCQGDGGAMVQTFYAASATVHFCPMLAIIFITLRMRVQQISAKGSSPQGWAQDAMYLCTGAILAQLLVCLLIGCATGSPPEVSEHETFHVKSEAEDRSLTEKAVIAIQVISLAALYGGAITVCISLFTVTPATDGAQGALIPTSFLTVMAAKL
jgi:hypothetical protein